MISNSRSSEQGQVTVPQTGGTRTRARGPYKQWLLVQFTKFGLDRRLTCWAVQAAAGPFKGIYEAQAVITKDKGSVPLTSSKNVSKTNTDLCKTSVTDTNLYRIPLVSILKRNSHHAAPQKLWVGPPGSQTPQPFIPAPHWVKSSHPAFSFVPFHASCSPVILDQLIFPKPNLCSPAPALHPADSSPPVELLPSLSSLPHRPMFPDPTASWSPFLPSRPALTQIMLLSSELLLLLHLSHGILNPLRKKG